MIPLLPGALLLAASTARASAGSPATSLRKRHWQTGALGSTSRLNLLATSASAALTWGRSSRARLQIRRT